MKEFLNQIERGDFEVCEIIMKWNSHKGKPPREFYEDADFLGLVDRDKGEIKKMRYKLILGIANRIYEKQNRHGDTMNTDNYSRFLHALTLLGITDKEMQIIPKNLNERYDIAYKLWKLEKGSSSWKIINEVSWKFSELYKRLEMESE